LVQFGIDVLIPQTCPTLALTLLGIGVFLLVPFDQLRDIGLVILCHNTYVFPVNLNTGVYFNPNCMTDSSDTPPQAPESSALSDRERRTVRMIPFIVGCALFMQMLDSTVVATALPAMAEALGTSPVRLNVAITSYLLAVAAFVPVSGWPADRHGARRVFMAAIALFSLTSPASALAQNLTHLVLAQ